MIVNAYMHAPAGPVLVPFVKEPMLSSGWEPVTGPSAFYDAGTDRTYVAWQFNGYSGNKGAHFAYYDHDAQAWSPVYIAGNFGLANDDHGHPAIVRDADGYLYCFFGSHVNAQKLSVSTEPDDPSAWTQETNLAGDYTYPKVVLVGSTLYLMMRDSSVSSNWTLVLRTATPTSGVATFGSPITLVDFGSDSRVYQGEAHVVGTDIHFACTFANAADSYRQHIYYFVYDTLTGALSNFDGSYSTSSVSLPVTFSDAQTSYRVHNYGSNEGDMASLQFDSGGNAHLLWAEEDGISEDSYVLRHMYLSGGSWSSPVTISSIQDRSGFGYVNTYCLVPGGSGSMEAWYNISGNMTRRILPGAGSSWGDAETIKAKGSYDFVQVAAVRNAHSDLRVLFAENLGSLTDSSAVPLGLYVYGDNGIIEATINDTGIDPNWDDVVLLLGAESRDGAVRVIDESPGSWVVNVFGGAQIDTAQSRFGSGSIFLDGNGDYLLTPNDTLFSGSTGDFTIEAWIRLNETGRIQTIANKRPSSSSHEYSFGIRETNVLYFQMFSSGTQILYISGSTTLSTGTWYHVAVSRNGTTSTIFLDGAVEASGTSDAASNASSGLYIGRDNGPAGSGRDFHGWIDEFRFTRAARYTGAFTPPSSAFPRR